MEGTVVGRHDGIALYTIGQKRGSGIPEGMRVVDIKAKDNTLNVSGNFNVSIAGSEPVNAGIVFDGVNDLNNNVLQYDLSVNAFGADLASGIVTFTKESLFVNSELLGSDTYRVDFENFVERFDASEWSRLLNLKLQDKLESEEFDAAMEDIVSQENYSEEMKKIYEESFADLEVKYEKADKMTVNIDGKDVSCNGVNMILDMDDLNAALADWSDKLVESEYYNKIKEELKSIFRQSQILLSAGILIKRDAS